MLITLHSFPSTLSLFSSSFWSLSLSCTRSLSSFFYSVCFLPSCLILLFFKKSRYFSLPYFFSISRSPSFTPSLSHFSPRFRSLPVYLTHFVCCLFPSLSVCHSFSPQSLFLISLMHAVLVLLILSLPPFYLSVSCSPTFSLYFYPHIIALFIPFYRLPPSPSHTCSLHTLFPSLFNPFLTISPSIFSLFCADVTLLLVHFSFSLSHPLYILFLLFPSLSFL